MPQRCSAVRRPFPHSLPGRKAPEGRFLQGLHCLTGYAPKDQRSISSELVSLKKISSEATMVIVRIVDRAAAVP